MIPHRPWLPGPERRSVATSDSFEHSAGIAPLDVLYNNAGSSHGVFGQIHTLDIDGFDRVMRTNIKGTFLCSKFGIPHLLANGGGSVINVASAVGLVGWARGAALCTAKGGIVLMTKAAPDYAQQNIRVNCLCPGSTRTAQTESRLKGAFLIPTP